MKLKIKWDKISEVVINLRFSDLRLITHENLEKRKVRTIELMI
jgi:hypothetical protein